MTGTPCCLALLMTAAALGESRFTITRTLAPSLSIWSAIVPNFALSPLAFWMSASTPASWKAFVSNGRSAPSQRAEEAVSGRITPTLDFFAAAVLVALLPLEPDEELSSLPHAATVKPSATVTAHATRARCFMWFSPSSGYRRGRLSANSKYSGPNVRVSRRSRASRPPEHERDGPEDLGSVAERALQDVYVVGRGTDRAAPQRLPQRPEHQLPGRPEVPADDDLLGVEEVAQRRDRRADRAAGVGDRAGAPGVALEREADGVVKGQLVAVHVAQRAEHGGRAGEGLQAAAVPAAADRSSRLDDGVAELARGPAGADVGRAGDDEAGADARRGLHVGHVLRAPAGAPHPLAQRAEVGVVLDLHGMPERVRDRIRRADVDPTGKDRRVAELAARAVDRPGQPHPDPDELAAAHRRLIECVLEHQLGERDRLAGRQVGVQRAVALGEQLVREVAERDPQVALAEVDPG